jgi:hypothetical protein
MIDWKRIFAQSREGTALPLCRHVSAVVTFDGIKASAGYLIQLRF